MWSASLWKASQMPARRAAAPAVGDLEAPLPPDEQRNRRDVRRGRAQSFPIEGRAHLLGGTAEVTEGPEQLDVGIAHGAHRGQGPLGIPVHRVAHRIELEPDTGEAARSDRAGGYPRPGDGRGPNRLDERSAMHA